MKTPLLIISLLFLAACSDTPKLDKIKVFPEPSITNKLQLVDSMGYVSIILPTRYDTSFSWIHYSDCGKPCAKNKYRIQPKTLRITKESGFYFTGDPKDSIDRFTVVHSGWFPFHDNADSSLVIGYHKHKKVDLTYDPATYKVKSDTIEKINDRYFSIISIDLFDTTKAQYSKKLLAATSIKGNIVEFNFELLTKTKDSSTDNFLENSKSYLRSVRLSNGR